MKAQIEKVTKLLESHDFWYMMSDDFKVWERGFDAFVHINNELAKLPKDQAVELWDAHAPVQMRNIYTRFDTMQERGQQ